MERLKNNSIKGLRWLERYTKTDMVYLFKGGFWLNINQFLSAVFGLLLTIIFANLVSVEIYGIYRYVLSIYTIIIILSLPGIDTALTRSLSKNMDGAFFQATKIKIKWSYLGSLGSILFAVYKYNNNDHTLGFIFLIIATLFPLLESLSLYSSVLNGKKLFKTWSIIDSLSQFFSVACLSITIFFSTNIFLIILAYFIPILITRIIATIYTKRNFIKNSVEDVELISYGKSLTFYQIVSRTISSIDQIALFHFLGPAQVAIFSLSTAIPVRIQSLFKTTGTLALPKFSESTKKNDSIVSLPKKMLWLLMAVIIVCILYILFSPLIFKYIFPKYLPALIYSKVAIFYTLSAITYPFSSYLLAHKRIKENYIFGIVNLAVKITTLAIFVPMLGIWGAIISMLSTSFVTIIISIFLIYREKIISSEQ